MKIRVVYVNPTQLSSLCEVIVKSRHEGGTGERLESERQSQAWWYNLYSSTWETGVREHYTHKTSLRYIARLSQDSRKGSILGSQNWSAMVVIAVDRKSTKPCT